MATIALIGLLGGGVLEWHNRGERDDHARRSANTRRLLKDVEIILANTRF